ALPRSQSPCSLTSSPGSWMASCPPSCMAVSSVRTDRRRRPCCSPCCCLSTISLDRVRPWMATTRREFLKTTIGAAAGSAALTAFAPLTSRALSFGRRSAGDQRVLVVLQLSGGNDGLNTVVPYAHDAYYRARPVLAVRADSVLKLDDQVG